MCRSLQLVDQPILDNKAGCEAIGGGNSYCFTHVPLPTTNFLSHFSNRLYAAHSNMRKGSCISYCGKYA